MLGKLDKSEAIISAKLGEASKSCFLSLNLEELWKKGRRHQILDGKQFQIDLF